MRFPLIRQQDQSDCGPAALATVAKYHGKQISIAKLRDLAQTDKSGTTLAGLIEAAKQIGFEPKAVRADFPALAQAKLPAIAHWKENNRSHFVVLYGVNPYRIADPASGRRKLTPDQFRNNWTGVLLLLTPTPDLKSAISSPPNYGRLTKLLSPYKKLFLDVLIAAVLATILGLLSSFFIQALVDHVFVLGRKPALNSLGLGMALVLLARVAFLALRTYLLARLSERIDADTVLGFYRHLLGLPLPFFTSRKTGEILSRINDCVKIRVAVSATTLGMLVDALLLGLGAAAMLYLDWEVTAWPLSMLPVVGVMVWILSGEMRGYQRRAMEKASEMESLMVEAISSMQTVKALRAEGVMRRRMEAQMAEMQEAAFGSQMTASWSVSLGMLVSGTAGLLLLLNGGTAVLDGRMSIGQLMALNTMMGMLLGPLERLAGANQSIQDAMVAAQRLGDVLDLEPELAKERESAIDCRVKGAVEFDSVGFQYSPAKVVLGGFSMKIEAGECVGIVGESGSGKTTIANLLGRFYEPQAGAIRVDGVDIRDYTLDCLRREIAFVPQDIVLFEGTIAENLRCGCPSAEPVEVLEAARSLRVGHLHVRVGERGLALSGGERQRVALARAVLQDAPILVLDEPTSHLDAESEAAVQALMDARRGHKTTIVITHRPLKFDRLIHVR